MQYFLQNRHTQERNAAVFSSQPKNLRETEGLYSGFDLIPDIYNSDGSSKTCACGVSTDINSYDFLSIIYIEIV